MATRKKKATTTRSDETGTRTRRTAKTSVAARAAKKPATSTTKAGAKTAAATAKTGAKTASRKAGDPLAVYRSKRDFGKTPEPQGQRSSKWKKGTNPFFVIQKHAASRLHYDFRLEVDGVLKSWAVPKGPSMNPQDKRLAVETEDHPIDYADFEGIIPKNEYGGGTVIVWDAGPYRNVKQHKGRELSMQEAYERGTIEIWLEGRKIRGGFALVHSRMGDNAKNWLLIKMRDECADADADVVGTHTQSVMSGKTIEEMAARPGKVWSSK